MLEKTKIKIGAAITSGIMGFAAIGTSVGIIANHSQVTNQSVKVVRDDKTGINIFNSKNTNNYEKLLSVYYGNSFAVKIYNKNIPLIASFTGTTKDLKNIHNSKNY